jgi:hypothetical protein
MSCCSDYTQNDLVRLSLAVTQQSDGTPISPTTLTAKVKLPDGSIDDLTASIVQDGIGLYHVDFLPTMVGAYLYEFIGTGAAQIAAVGSFNVDQATF